MDSIKISSFGVCGSKTGIFNSSALFLTGVIVFAPPLSLGLSGIVTTANRWWERKRYSRVGNAISGVPKKMILNMPERIRYPKIKGQEMILS
jgi:hypothetical protein